MFEKFLSVEMSRTGEDRWLWSSDPSTETPEREVKLDLFMERWA